MKETEIQKQILDFLHILGIFAWRNNNIRVPGRSFNGLLGAPDIIMVYQGKFVALEIKTQKGKLSEDQEAFKARCEEAGGIYLVLRSLTEAKEAIAWLRSLC